MGVRLSIRSHRIILNAHFLCLVNSGTKKKSEKENYAAEGVEEEPEEEPEEGQLKVKFSHRDFFGCSWWGTDVPVV